MPPLRSLARLAPAILVLSSALPHRASAQEASRDSSPPTLFGRLGLRGMHLSMGGMTVPYEGHRAGALQFRYVFTPKRWPAWSVAYAGNAVVKGDTTAYRAPGAQNFHPEYCVATQEVELQRRWRLQKLVHPLATASAQPTTNPEFSFLASCVDVPALHTR